MKTIKELMSGYELSKQNVLKRRDAWNKVVKGHIEANFAGMIDSNALKNFFVEKNDESKGFESICLVEGKTPAGIFYNGNHLTKTGAALIFSLSPIGLINIYILSPEIEELSKVVLLPLYTDIEATEINQDLIFECVANLLEASTNWHMYGRFEITREIGVAMV